MRLTQSSSFKKATAYFALSCALFLTACGSHTDQPITSLQPQGQTPNQMSPQEKPKGTLPKSSIKRLGSTEISSIKPIEKKTGRFAECGVESYNIKADPLCSVKEYHLRSSAACQPIVKDDPQFGVKTFRESRGEPCGPEEFFEKPDESCGVDEATFWSDWNKSCPAGYASGSWYSALANTQTRVHSYSPTDIRVETRHLCLRKTPKTCARPEFGVKLYKSCRHPSFGPETFNSGIVGYQACRHESHGPETFNSCRHETFGVEKYKSCSVYMTQAEMDGYLKAQSDVLPALSSTLLDSAAIYYSHAGKQRALACLVKSIVDDPNQKELAEDLKSRYFILTDRFWSEEEAKQCAQGFVDLNDAECEQNDTSITCTALKSFQTVRAAMYTTRMNLTLLSQEAHERGNKAATDALNGLLKSVSNK